MRAIACPRVGDVTLVHATICLSLGANSRGYAQPHQIAYPVVPKVRIKHGTPPAWRAGRRWPGACGL